MIVAKYESYFHKLTRQGTSIFNTEYERVRCFLRGLRLPICISTQCFVVVERFLVKVSDHTQVMEDMHHEGCENSYKRPRFQDRFNESRHSSQWQY